MTAEDEVKSLAKSLHVVRTAIHAMGGCTPNWEEPPQRRATYSPGPVQLEHLVGA